MKLKIVISVLILMLLIAPITVAKTIEDKPKTSILVSDDAPVWSVGDSWTYEIDYEGGLEDAVTFDWTFENMVFTVSDSTSSDYLLDVTGEITGDLTIFGLDIISGNLKDTFLSGTVTVEKSNIGIKNVDIFIEGTLVIVLINKDFTIDINLAITPSYNPIDFPIGSGNNWEIPLSAMSGSFDISLLPNPVYVDDIAGGSNAECTGMESRTVSAGTYEAYRVLSSRGDITELYYAPDVGNFIQAFGDSENSINVNLKSTNYQGGGDPGAPNKPQKPQGPTSGNAGNSYTYSTSTTDVEGQDIYYLFSWGDGSDSGWLGPYPSGDTVTSSKTWNSKGAYSVKVKAKDTEEHVSSWSDSLSVIITKSKSVNNFGFYDEKILFNFPIFKKILNFYS